MGITPEVLPVIITMALSSGALRMARQQVVVKRLISVEDLGNVDVLCCDKTGTLSQGEFALRQCVDPDGVSCPSVLLYGALAGSSGLGRPGPSPNPTDQAIWRHPDIGSPSAAALSYRVLGQNPFDYTRRRASVLVEDATDRRLVVKGAVESILPVCTRLGLPVRRHCGSMQPGASACSGQPGSTRPMVFGCLESQASRPRLGGPA